MGNYLLVYSDVPGMQANRMKRGDSLIETNLIVGFSYIEKISPDISEIFRNTFLHLLKP